ncbi:MAG: hypothetical protein FJ255_04085 [Phycisphaerae bacterium]|nr:hypothetical protein [Phycisphaerae bacterium]
MFARSVLALITLAGLAPSALLAQHDGHKPAAQPAAQTDAKARVGDPYPFNTCPISGMELGSMGEPPAKVYEGREVRFCCASCFPGFERDVAASLAKLDEKIVKDQRPLYPLKTSVVSGKPLAEKPVEAVVGNRLFLLTDEAEKGLLGKDPKKYLLALDRAVIEAQGKDYPLSKCPVSDEALDSMGGPVDVVVAGRLVRLCCDGCKEDVEKAPARFIAAVDGARKGRRGGDPAGR